MSNGWEQPNGGNLMKNRRKRMTIMAEVAIMAALAFILDFFSFKIWAQGGSVSLTMLPIFVMAFRRGLIASLATGLIVGLLNMMYNPYIVHWLQGLIDYPIAFLVVGFAGLFYFNKGVSNSRKIISITVGVFVGSLLRYLAHFTAGVVWFGEFAPEGTPVLVYSFTYNLTYMGPAFILCLIVVLLLNKSSDRILHQAN
ncbi:energy-coupled thiamine transporter ThiT [Evansella halocellulosilytica]|uniref:energy-coupled thiamine transporter ThiT n=1 Tax=Evansella halocellulosilytica TaxID=2011013 RepID=UPI00211CAAC9|nr:energy-coupled thiamine transporter ThiT [Evansella halocellulosilytica]